MKLTPLREQVLRLIWQSHQALGAYQLMEMLAEAEDRRVAPPTVYRTLDFLQEHHFIHRVHSLNAFVGCPTPEQSHQHYFMICRQCQVIIELSTEALQAPIARMAAEAQFTLERQNLELQGLCPNCGDQ